jgi:hypothetical protein
MSAEFVSHSTPSAQAASTELQGGGSGSGGLAGGGTVEAERVGSVPASRITAWQAALAETPLALATKSTTVPHSPVPKSFHRLPSAKIEKEGLLSVRNGLWFFPI